jgi:RNase P subunit RPR2
MSVCPKCDSILVSAESPALRHIRAARCLICGWYAEDGFATNRDYHAAWVKEENPRVGIVKERNNVRDI